MEKKSKSFNKLIGEKKSENDEIENLLKEKNDLNAKEEKIEKLKNLLKEINNKENYNPLNIVTFNSKEDYNKVYNHYPHSYLINMFKNMCNKKKNYIYVNKAPAPEDVIWGI